MSLEEIKAHVKAGETVYHQSQAYEVRCWSSKSGEDRFVILCTLNNHAIGLTWLDGVTVNGALEDFFRG